MEKIQPLKKLTLFGKLIALLLFSSNLSAQDILINEIITSNTTVIVDEDNSYQDWIELYNPGTIDVNLLGYGISDDALVPYKWVFPNVVITPGQHLLVWCSDKNRVDPLLPLHTNFKISSDGEVITLTNAVGNITDQLPATVIPQNKSYGRSPSGSTTFTVFEVPTPAAQNIADNSEALSAPQFSAPSGTFEDSFTLTLTHTDPEVTILYTLDGSEPSEANIGGKSYTYKNSYPELPGNSTGELQTASFETLTYSTALEIQDRSNQPNKVSSFSTTYHYNAHYIPAEPVVKSTVVRAMAIKDGMQASEIVTRNYYVGEAANFSLPIVSINIDEDRFFSYDSGIHVAGALFDQWREQNATAEPWMGSTNYNQSGDSWEKRGNFSYFDNNSEVINQDVGIRINGGFSRNFPLKSLRIYGRQEYGDGTLSYPFFGEDYGYDSFKRILLRNSGNDFHNTFFRDAFIQRTVQHLDFCTQPYQPSVVFINGEYWGLLNLRERYDKAYFERVYDIADDEIDLLENGWEVDEGDIVHYNNFIAYLNNNDLDNSANFDYVTTQMDVESYTDYYLTNIYADNTDWPGNNVVNWRKRTASYEPDAAPGQDGRWRWAMKDTDFGFGISSNVAFTNNTLSYATTVGDDSSSPSSTLIMRKLLQNESYRKYFITRFADLINTTFQPERLIEIIEEMKSGIAAEIPMLAQRWDNISASGWEGAVEIMEIYSEERPDFQREHIREQFDIPENVPATLDVSDTSHGYIRINTIDILPTTPGVAANPYPWTGIYFSGVPVTLTAAAYPGYVFSHWTGANNSTTPEITINATDDFSVTAHFVPNNDSVEEPISFWMADTSMDNDTPFESITSTYELAAEGNLEYQSCLPGYPYTDVDPLWRKASLERANAPTEINYIPVANNDIPFEDANLRGFQVRQPFQNGDEENTLIFNQSTVDYKEIVARFAAKNEDAATGIIVDYATAEETAWTTEGLTTSSFPLTENYALFEIDFSSIASVNNNSQFKFRLRFTGDNMTADEGGKVLFNNFSVSGKLLLDVPSVTQSKFTVYPNPVSDKLLIKSEYNVDSYKLFGLDGRIIRKGETNNSEINVSELAKGLYLLELTSGTDVYTTKIVKK